MHFQVGFKTRAHHLIHLTAIESKVEASCYSRKRTVNLVNPFGSALSGVTTKQEVELDVELKVGFKLVTTWIGSTSIQRP